MQLPDAVHGPAGGGADFDMPLIIFHRHALKQS